ncbi:FecR family protein [Saccharicrinis sp. GN24d3]|uniref:FecR family protein n=1 Tax=Saccharicrinis sp. GN24d3 TaxID=3458416 RepID=UPI004035EFD0
MDILTQIQAVLKGQLSEKEKIAFYKKLKEDEELRELYYEQKNLWVKTSIQPVLSKKEHEGDFELIWNKVNSSKQKRLNINWFRQVAAIVLLIGAAGIIGYLLNSGHEDVKYVFNSEHRSMASVVLPDGSRVKLNAGTELVYHESAKNNERRVTLEGEAYFDINHDEENPFVIDFGDLEIIDVGTAFNVKAYEGYNSIITTLFEGTVDIVVDKDTKASLVPGQLASVSRKDNQVVVAAAKTKQISAWMENRFEFQDETLEDIMKELSLWYDFEISWKNETLKNKKLFFHVNRSLSANSILRILSRGSDFKFVAKKEEGVIKTVELDLNN